MSAANQERLYQVILAPIVSEKGTFVADKFEQVAFRVASTATKPEIKAAVELLFKVQVDSVQVLNVKGKQKRFGRFNGLFFLMIRRPPRSTLCPYLRSSQGLEKGICLPEAGPADRIC